MQENISPGIWICLIFSYISGFSTLFLQEAKLLGPDVWIAYICGIAMSFGILCSLYMVQRRYTGLPMPAVFDRLLGRSIAKVVLCVYLIYILEIQGAAFQALTSFYRTVVLPNTSPGQIILLIALTTAYASSLGLGTIVRTVPVLLSFFLFAILLIIFFIYKNVTFNPFLPLFQHRLSEIAYGSLLSFYFPFGKSIVFCFLFFRVKNSSRIIPYTLIALALSGLYLFAATYLSFGSLGMNLVKSVTFPFFSAIQMVKFGEYLERIEITIIGIWTVFTLFEIIILQYVFMQVFAYIFGIKHVRAFVLPVGLLFFALSTRSFNHQDDIVYYNSRIAPFSTLLPTVAIPLLLLLISFFKKANGSGEDRPFLANSDVSQRSRS